MEKNLECKNCGKKIYWSGNFKVYAHQSLLDQKNCERPEPDMSSFRPAPSQPSMEDIISNPANIEKAAKKSNEMQRKEVRDEKIARLVKEFRKLYFSEKKIGLSLSQVESWLTQTLTTLLNEE